MQAPAGGTGVGVEIVSAPSAPPHANPNAVLKPVGPTNTVLPAAEKPAERPSRSTTSSRSQSATAHHRGQRQKKKPKADLSDESSSKKKKKKGLAKLNPF